MARKTIPVYRDRRHVYRADTCGPLVAAAERGLVTLEAIAHANYPGRLLGDAELPGLQSAGYWDAKREQDWGLPWHRNEGVEVTLLATGSLPFSVGDRTWRLEPGSLTVTRPWQPHKLGQPHVGIGRLYWIILDVGVRQPHQEWRWPDWLVLTPADLAELTGYLRENEQPVWPATPAIGACFRQIGTAVTEPDGVSQMAVFINELLLQLLRLFRCEEVPRDKALTTAQRSVELFLESLAVRYAEQWTLDDMARSCGLGVTRFVHYCRHLVNLPPMQYLAQLRTRAAAAMLAESGERSITDIALACGFSSSQYFATCFRKYYGQTPGRYRADGT